MKREDYIWVAIRVFGIYLLVLATVSLPSIVASAYSAWAVWGSFSHQSGGSDVGPVSTLVSGLAARYMTSLIHATGKLVFFSLAGWYFLRRGSLIFKLVSVRNPLADQTAGDAPTTSEGEGRETE